MAQEPHANPARFEADLRPTRVARTMERVRFIGMKYEDLVEHVAKHVFSTDEKWSEVLGRPLSCDPEARMKVVRLKENRVALRVGTPLPPNLETTPSTVELRAEIASLGFDKAARQCHDDFIRSVSPPEVFDLYAAHIASATREAGARPRHATTDKAGKPGRCFLDSDGVLAVACQDDEEADVLRAVSMYRGDRGKTGNERAQRVQRELEKDSRSAKTHGEDPHVRKPRRAVVVAWHCPDSWRLEDA